MGMKSEGRLVNATPNVKTDSNVRTQTEGFRNRVLRRISGGSGGRLEKTAQ
jgi:hypothetical protein